MTIGTGIAIAGVWIFSGLVFHSKTTSGFAAILSLAVAIIVTATLAGQ